MSHFTTESLVPLGPKAGLPDLTLTHDGHRGAGHVHGVGHVGLKGGDGLVDDRPEDGHVHRVDPAARPAQEGVRGHPTVPAGGGLCRAGTRTGIAVLPVWSMALMLSLIRLAPLPTDRPTNSRDQALRAPRCLSPMSMPDAQSLWAARNTTATPAI